MSNSTETMLHTEATETTAALENTTEIQGIETFPAENNQFENMVYTLPMMGKGMFGIFIVTLIIIVGVVILNKVTSNKK